MLLGLLMIGKFVAETKEPVATLGNSLCWLPPNCTLKLTYLPFFLGLSNSVRGMTKASCFPLAMILPVNDIKKL